VGASCWPRSAAATRAHDDARRIIPHTVMRDSLLRACPSHHRRALEEIPRATSSSRPMSPRAVFGRLTPLDRDLVPSCGGTVPPARPSSARASGGPPCISSPSGRVEVESAGKWCWRKAISSARSPSVARAALGHRHAPPTDCWFARRFPALVGPPPDIGARCTPSQGTQARRNSEGEPDEHAHRVLIHRDGRRRSLRGCLRAADRTFGFEEYRRISKDACWFAIAPRFRVLRRNGALRGRC